MAEKFKAGDLVKLKSGGPKMTVVVYKAYGSADEKKYKCRWWWFVEKNQHAEQPAENSFTEAELEFAGGEPTVTAGS